MHYLTVDFGSTYTKLTLIDVANAEIVATASAFTTITTDVLEGFNNAWQKILAQHPDAHYDRLLSCSSAAGGLKMVALGCFVTENVMTEFGQLNFLPARQ